MSRGVNGGCRWLVASVAALWLVQGISVADKGVAVPEGWEMRTMRVPAGFRWSEAAPSPLESPNGENGKSEGIPSLPSPLASEQQWDEWIRKSSEVIARRLEMDGKKAPEGSLFLHDAASGTLAVRSTKDVIRWLESLVDLKWDYTASFGLDIMQADAAAIGQVVTQTAEQSDHTAALQRLRALANEGKATEVRHLQLETVSGQRVDAQAGTDAPHVTGMQIDAAGRVAFLRDTRCVGTHLEVEPEIGPDSASVKAVITLEHHYAPPVQRQEFAGQAGTLGRLMASVTDFRCVTIKTSTELLDGTTQLLGVWTPEGMPEFARGDVMQAAFLSVKVLLVVPEGNTTLMERLKRYVARVGPPPTVTASRHSEKKTKEKDKDKEGAYPEMETRTLKVPRNFFSDSLQGLPEAQEETKNWRCVGPTDIFKFNGIPFPEGSVASYITQSSLLVVRNTPKNLDQVESFLKTVAARGHPKLLVHTLHIVEGEGALIRKMTAASHEEASQNGLWKKIEQQIAQGTLKLRSTARLEGRSGERIKCELGTVQMSVADANFGDAETEAPKDTKTPGTGDEVPVTAPKKQDNPVLMTIMNDLRPAGTQLELDSTLEDDRTTASVILALEYHYAPPSVHAPPDNKAGGASRIDFPATDFHLGRVVTDLKFTSGMIKLIGTWKPEGAPEFEGKDVMQAVFLRVDVVPVESPETVETK